MKIIEKDNYFFGTNEPVYSSKKLVLIIYDIIDNKRRLKFSKFLEKYGIRVQKSAFEMIISTKQYNDLVAKIPSYINDEDNVRVYRLKAVGEVISWGSGMTCAEEVIIL
ncbi:MAG: CRISPR-associated endonuclease Cas2 [Lachnospirales bacterium]